MMDQAEFQGAVIEIGHSGLRHVKVFAAMVGVAQGAFAHQRNFSVQSGTRDDFCGDVDMTRQAQSNLVSLERLVAVETFLFEIRVRFEAFEGGIRIGLRAQMTGAESLPAAEPNG